MLDARIAGQESPPERRRCEQDHAKFVRGSQGVDLRILSIQSERQVFGLDRRDRVDLMRASQCLAITFAEADELDLEFPVTGMSRDI